MSLEQVLLNETHVTLTAPERPLTCAIKNTTIHPPHYLGLLRCYHSQIIEFTQRCSHQKDSSYYRKLQNSRVVKNKLMFKEQ